MCGNDLALVECPGAWQGKRLPVLTLSETEEYIETPQNIINYLISREVEMDEHLSERNISEITAFTSLITESLYTALMFSWWLDEQSYQSLTKPLYSSVFGFPYNFLKPMEMRRYIKCMILSRYSLDDNVDMAEISKKVYESSKRCLQILSTKLAGNPYILGNVPSQLDAYLFSHLALVRSSPGSSKLKDDLSKLQNLEEYTLRIHKKFYPKLLRQYTPPLTEDTVSLQRAHKLASAGAVLLLAALFVFFRRDNALRLNDTQLQE